MAKSYKTKIKMFVPLFWFSTFLVIIFFAIAFYIYAKFKNQLESLETAKQNLLTSFQTRFDWTQNVVSSLNGLIDPEKLKSFEELRIWTMGYDVFSNDWIKIQAQFSQKIDEIFSTQNENINFIDQKTTNLENKTQLETAISAYQQERKQFFEMIKSFPYSFFAGSVDKSLYPEI